MRFQQLFRHLQQLIKIHELIPTPVPVGLLDFLSIPHADGGIAVDDELPEDSAVIDGVVLDF